MANYRCSLGDVQIISDASWKKMRGEGEKRNSGYMERDYGDVPVGSFCAPFDMPLIPRNEWGPRLQELKATKGLLSDVIAANKWTVKNQKQTPLCWVFAAVGAYEVALMSSQNSKVRLSPASVGAYVQNWRMAGGWSSNAIKEIGKSGVVPSSMWADTSYDRKFDNAETKAERKKWRLTEWIDCKPRNLDQLATLLLTGRSCAVGYNHWSHAIFAVDLIQQGNEWGVLIANSWSESWGTKGFGVLMGSKAIPDDCVAPTVGLHQK